MENIVSISDDDPNNQLAFVQQLVSQLSVAGNPVTINVVNNHVHNGDIVSTVNNNNGNSNNDNDRNDNSNNIVTKEYFDEEVDILSEALSDLDEKVVNLSEALTDVKAEQTHQLAKLVDGITTSITAGMTALVAGISPAITELVAGISPAITALVAATTQLNNIITPFINSNVILLAGQARLHGTLPPLLMRIMNEIRDGFQSLDAVDDDDDDDDTVVDAVIVVEN